MTNIEKLNEQLNDSGIRARVWQKNGKNRIYLSSAKDISAYIEFDEVLDEADVDDLFFGCALKVYTNVETQPVQWIINREKQMTHGIMTQIQEAAVEGTVHSKLLAGEICEDWRDVVVPRMLR